MNVLGERPSPALRFALGGIPVEIRPLFPLVLAALGASAADLATGAVWILVAGASVLWHELGHAAMMRRFGFPSRIELNGFGGVTCWPACAAPTAAQACAVTAAGPGAGLALGGALWLVSTQAGPLPRLAESAVFAGLWVNVGWSLFNLLPILPLDGAHLLDHLTALVTGRREPARWVGAMSALAGGAVALHGLRGGAPYLAVLGGLGVAAGASRLRGGRGPGATAQPVRARGRRPGPLGWLRGRRARARLADARAGRLAVGELGDLVVELVRLGRGGEVVALCRDRLSGFSRGRDAAPLARLASDALWEAGEAERALEVAQLAFEQLHAPDHAHDAACRLVAAGRLDEAMAWTERAARAAGPDAGVLLRDPALDPLRDRPDFARLVAASAPRGWVH